MIRLYCRRKEKNAVLCEDCRELLTYSHKRLDLCRYGNKKGACKKCPTHCYASAFREKIREVMRFSGPRLILHYPLAAIRHIFISRG
ncbi:Nitrous oxide-stimulated promoter [Alistipes sp. cv1]|nr:Nitrous oxide-stimulated promoter [Faecalibacterium prausnitzii]